GRAPSRATAGARRSPCAPRYGPFPRTMEAVWWASSRTPWMSSARSFLGIRREHFGKCGMRQHDIRVALQRLVIVRSETYSLFDRREQAARRTHEPVHVRHRRRLIRVESLVDLDHEGRDRPEPHEPRIVNHQLQQLAA